MLPWLNKRETFTTIKWNMLKTELTGEEKARRGVDWPVIREAFITRTPTPQYKELAEEFMCTPQAVSACARDQDWPGMRLAVQEKKLKEAGASELILAALQSEGSLLNQARSVIQQFLSAVEITLQSLVEDQTGKPSSRADTLNKLGFAVGNLGKFVDSVGLVGMPGTLRKEAYKGGQENGGSWQKGMLQQINVTVQNLQSEAKQAEASKAQPVKDEDMG